MNRRLLIVVTEDPRQSARPAEAIRIAVGVGAWKQVGVTVCLRGEAVRALGEFSVELKDGENFSRYLPLIAEQRRVICVERDSPVLKELGEPTAKFEEISDARLAELVAQHDYVLRF